MKFAKKPTDLVGKKILWIHIPNESQEGIIIAEDNTLLMFASDYDEGRMYTLFPHECRHVLKNNDELRKHLFSSGAISEEEMKSYEDELRKEYEQRLTERKAKEEMENYKLYLRLKEQYEGKEPVSSL